MRQFFFKNSIIIIYLSKAFSFVALIQNLDILLGTIACTPIYRASLSFFAGLVFIFGIVSTLIALILIL